MLEALRRGAQGWVAKLLFALLILSFGIFWNVSDFIGRITRGSLAKVGSTEITQERFQRALQNRLEQISQRSGQRVTTETAVQLGLDRQVMDGLLGQGALLQQAHNLGLGLSNESLVERLKQQKEFQTPDGKFSRAIYDNFLRQAGFSEAGFLSLYREDELRRQISDSLAAAVVVPKPVLDERHAWLSETRNISTFVIDRAKVPAIPEPDDAKLKEHYEATKSEYMTPEYRKLAVLVLSLEALKKELVIPDDELKAAYEDQRASYDKLERRRIQQIAFKDKAAAEAAKKAIDGGKNFLDVAKENGAKETDINLGWLTKNQMIDPKIAEVAFGLQRDAISDPVDGKFSTSLVRVIEIDPGKTSTFDEVKEKVRDTVASKKAAKLLQERADLVEEDRNAGKTFKEIAAAQKLAFYEGEVTDKNETADGKKLVEHPDAPTLMTAAFQAAQGDEHDPVTLGDDGYAWYDVQAIKVPVQKEFDAVKDEVKKSYIEKETEKKLAEMAAGFAERITKGEDMAKVALEGGGKLITMESLRRDAVPPDLTEQAMRQAFGIPKGQAGTSASPDGKSRSVFRVDAVTEAGPPDETEAKALSNALNLELQNDYIGTYVAALKSSLGASVNEAQLKRLTGADRQ